MWAQYCYQILSFSSLWGPRSNQMLELQHVQSLQMAENSSFLFKCFAVCPSLELMRRQQQPTVRKSFTQPTANEVCIFSAFFGLRIRRRLWVQWAVLGGGKTLRLSLVKSNNVGLDQDLKLGSRARITGTWKERFQLRWKPETREGPT